MFELMNNLINAGLITVEVYVFAVILIEANKKECEQL
jgi:hypothetical protein